MSLSLVRRAAVVSVSVMLALVVPGCGSDDEPSAGETPSAETPTEPATTEPATTEPPATPSATQTLPVETPSAAPGSGSAETTEAAIARFETFLHALGTADVPTMCEIAGPAAAQAEAEGFGPCEATMAIMAGLPSAEQSTALQTARVDPGLVDDSTPGQVVIPVEAIIADASFTSGDLGDTTLAYQDGDWFVVD